MIEVCRESLFPARVNRRRVGPANIATDDPGVRSQRLQSPNHIGHVKSPVLPVCRRRLGAQTVEIDCHVNGACGDFGGELFEFCTPIIAPNGAATTLILRRSIVRPRMNIQPPLALRAAIPENLSRPPAFKITAAPNTNSFQLRKIKRAIQPIAATPFRRANIPIGMVVE